MTFLRAKRMCAIHLALCLVLGGTSHAQTNPKPGVFDHLGSNLAGSFSGQNLALHAGALASTYGIVQAGWDYDVHHYFNENPSAGTLGSPSAAAGALAPVLTAGSLWVYGKSTEQPEVVVAGNAVAQAVGITFTYHELLKAVTGRPAPQGVPESEMEDHSKTFRFGFLRGGLFWGWPSGHLSTNTAAVVSLSSFYPDNKPISVAKYTWMGYMFYGVVSHNGGSMHWFSDALAGTLMGYAIGRTVGSSFHDQLHPVSSSAPSGLSDRIHFYPVAIAEAPGLGMSVELF
ncbi:MAG TPA: phosphatase PAP2 family protein [Fibrobacteria bacterium]|nr:phosphatase PAP2 family protein [Fibrobacteria bacterium]